MSGPEPIIASHPAGDAIAAAFTRCFRTPPGERVIAHLRRVALERRLPPCVSDRELWHLEGQRHLVAQILNLVERGAADASTSSPAPVATDLLP